MLLWRFVVKASGTWYTEENTCVKTEITGEISMMYNAKERKLQLRNMQIDYITFGVGTKPLVMIQGLNTSGIKGTSVPLAWMYRTFAKDYTVYLFDRRPDVFDGITVKELADDVALAMDALKIQNADVIGVSQGGMIAQYLAINRPELVNKLALAVTLSRNNDTVEGVIKNWIALVQQNAMKQLVADMTEKMYSAAYIKRYKPFMPLLTVLQKPKDAQRFIILAKSCLTCNIYDELSKIQCPVFVIGGRQDKVVGADACVETAQKLGCRLFMYEHLGHAAYEEAKDFNNRIYEFLKE